MTTTSIAIPLISAQVSPGTRVGLFSSYEVEDGKRTLRTYGWGTYEGDFPLGDIESQVTYQTKEEKKAFFDETGKICAPRLRHDDGTITWGLLVWWDIEESINKYATDAEVVIEISLKDAMKEFDANLKNLQGYVDSVEDINVFNPAANNRNVGN